MMRILETTNHYFNYGDTLLENIMFTDWARGKFNVLLLGTIAAIIRFHIISVVCYFISINWWCDFVLHTCVSIGVTLSKGWVYRCCDAFHVHTQLIVDYLLNNYTIQNYRLWKRTVLLGVCVYAIAVCAVTDITSAVLVVYIIEYMIAFIVVDLIENKTIERAINDYKDKPRKIIHASLNIDEDYIPVKSPGIPKSTSIGSLSLMVINDYNV